MLAEDIEALLRTISGADRDAGLEPAAAPRETSMAGQVVSADTIVRELGQGGMGSVWLAHRSDGVPIERHCEQHSLGLATRVRLFLDVLAAVTHAHDRLILHRDLKPSNILVTAASEVKLPDFGIAKLFDQMRAVIETEPKRLSDAVLRNGSAGSAAARLKLYRAQRGDLDNIVVKALKKSPAERYGNAALLADDLRRYLNDEPVTARPDALKYKFAKFVPRHRLGVAASGVVAATPPVGVGVALWEASEAGRQRARVEGRIEFMLGDLRQKLQPVGRLDVLDAVGAKALDDYAAQAAGRLDADSLGRRARALRLTGEITERRGGLDEAMRVFRRAANSTAELMARDPRVGQRSFDHAQSVYWIGYMARRQRRTLAAETSFRQYQTLAQYLIRIDAGNLDWRIETAYAGVNLGVLHLEGSQSALALTAFAKLKDAWVNIMTLRPGLGVNLAQAWGWIAKAREAMGEFDAAIDAQRTRVNVLLSLSDANVSREVQQLFARGSYELGRLQLALGRDPQAGQSAHDALTQTEALVAVDFANTEWMAYMVFARASLAGDRNCRRRARQGAAAGGRHQAEQVERRFGWQHAVAEPGRG